MLWYFAAALFIVCAALAGVSMESSPSTANKLGLVGVMVFFLCCAIFMLGAATAGA